MRHCTFAYELKTNFTEMKFEKINKEIRFANDRDLFMFPKLYPTSATLSPNTITPVKPLQRIKKCALFV